MRLILKRAPVRQEVQRDGARVVEVAGETHAQDRWIEQRTANIEELVARKCKCQ